MKSVFAIFDSYSEAKEAVNALLNSDFPIAEINGVAQDEVIRANLDENPQTVPTIAASEQLDGSVDGIEALFGGEQPVQISPLGDVLAAGELATIMTKQSPESTGFQDALTDFGVPQESAAAYEKGVGSGGVLLWVRGDDGRVSTASGLMQQGGGKSIATNS